MNKKKKKDIIILYLQILKILNKAGAPKTIKQKGRNFRKTC